jgi:hypothetical protein
MTMFFDYTYRWKDLLLATPRAPDGRPLSGHPTPPVSGNSQICRPVSSKTPNFLDFTDSRTHNSLTVSRTVLKVAPIDSS